MNHSIRLACACGFVTLAPSLAEAHAFLDHAVPGVGSTVSASPRELQLDFTQGIVAALSGVRVAAVDGGAVLAGKLTGDAGDPEMLHVRLGRPLEPGTYVVTWHVVSVDTHPTSGSYKFTIAP